MATIESELFFQSPHGIEYREGTAPWAALFFAAFGLLFLAVSGLFLMELAQWPWHSGKVVGLLTVLVFAIFGLSALWLALGAVMPQHLQFEIASRRVFGRARSRFWPLRTFDVEFASIGPPIISATSREMDSDLYHIVFERGGRQILNLGSFEYRPDALFWKNRLDQIMQA